MVVVMTRRGDDIRRPVVRGRLVKVRTGRISKVVVVAGVGRDGRGRRGRVVMMRRGGHVMMLCGGGRLHRTTRPVVGGRRRRRGSRTMMMVVTREGRGRGRGTWSD